MGGVLGGVLGQDSGDGDRSFVVDGAGEGRFTSPWSALRVLPMVMGRVVTYSVEFWMGPGVALVV